jgi:hypothetical protein
MDWFTHMRRGEFEAAWRIGDTALVPNHTGPRHEQRIWSGASLANKRVLIRCYHGLGDTIMFARFIPLDARIAKETIVWAQPQLIPLLRTMRTDATYLPLHDGTPEVEYDVDIEIMELAHCFRVTPETIPRPPYLFAGGERRGGVGVVWRAGEWDPNRSIPDELIERLRPFHSLQHDEETPSNPLATAREMRALDLVVSVDTMTAHLAGAMGVPVFTLLPYDCDWRWMDEREDSPWYPSMRLFRQSRRGEWRDVIERVRYAIATMSDEPKKDSLNDWGIDVDKFKERAKESLAGAKDDLSEIAGTLRQTLVQAKDVLVGLQKGGAPAASELKTGFERAWNEIENAFKAARERAKEARAAEAADTAAAAGGEGEAAASEDASGEARHNVPPSDDAMSP